MKKGKMIISMLALVVALGAAFAFRAKSLPGNLYYYNSDFACVAAPCANYDQGPGNACQLSPLFTDDACTSSYDGAAWTTDGGN